MKMLHMDTTTKNPKLNEWLNATRHSFIHDDNAQ